MSSAASCRTKSWLRAPPRRAPASGRDSLAETAPGTWTRVAELEGAVVGFASTRLLPEPEYGARGEIKNLFVAGHTRRTGVGRALLADAARWLAANGGEPRRSLLVHGESAPRRRHDRLGGEVVGERPTDWDGIVVPETAYIWATAADLVHGAEAP